MNQNNGNNENKISLNLLSIPILNILIKLCKPHENINIELMVNNSNENNSNELLLIISNKYKEKNSLIIKLQKNGGYNISEYHNNKITKIKNNNKNISNILNNFINKNN